MAGKALLDTNVIIRLFDSDPELLDLKVQRGESLLCSVVLGELYFGAYNSQAVQKNLARLDDLAQLRSVVSCDERTADEYGKIKSELRAKGRPIPDNDIWIAALVRQHKLAIATRDNHFRHVDGVAVEEW